MQSSIKGKEKKGTVLSTVSFRYAIILSFSIFTLLVSSLFIQSYNFLYDWLPNIKEVVRAQEVEGISLQVKLNGEGIGEHMLQLSTFFGIIHQYGEDVLNNELAIKHYYESFHEDINEQEKSGGLSHSIWYHNNVSVYEHGPYKYVRNSTVLDNIFRATYLPYPPVLGLYAGMDDGMLRLYPEDLLYDNILIRKRQDCNESVALADLKRYDHRCQLWYSRALDKDDSIVIGRTWRGLKSGDEVGDLSKEIMLLSQAVRTIDGDVFGAIAMEVEDSSILDIVSYPILSNGYQFVTVSQSSNANFLEKYVLYHPNCSETVSISGECLLERLEPSLYAYDHIVDDIYDGVTGNATIVKEGDSWFVTYTSIPASSSMKLSIVGVVPVKDIEEDFLKLEDDMYRLAEYYLIGCCVILVLLLAVVTRLSSFMFKSLLNPLQEFNSRSKEMDEGLEVELGNKNLTNSFKYKQMRKVKSSFQSFDFILEDINSQYFSHNFHVAYERVILLEHIFVEMENESGLGVVFNNKGCILLKLLEMKNHEQLGHDCLKESIRIGHEVIESDIHHKKQGLMRYHTIALAGRYCNMGNYYQMVRDYKAALAVYEMSLVLYNQADDALGKARATGNIGHTYLCLREQSKARRLFTEAFDIAVEKFSNKKTAKSRELLQNSSMNLGIFYRVDHQYERARPYFVYALELSKHISKAVLFRCVSELIYIYNQSVDPRASAMANMLRNDENYYETVTPRSIHLVIDTSKAMRKKYVNKNKLKDGFSREFDDRCSDTSSMSSDVDEGMSRIEFARDCSRFIIKSCLCGKDFLSLTTFQQKISRLYQRQSLQANKDTLLDQLDDTLLEENCMGPCALYDAIQDTILSAYGDTVFSNYDTWIVVFTSGYDTASLRSLEDMEAIMAKINVNMIVVSLDGQHAKQKTVRVPSSRKESMRLAVMESLDDCGSEVCSNGSGKAVHFENSDEEDIADEPIDLDFCVLDNDNIDGDQELVSFGAVKEEEEKSLHENNRDDGKNGMLSQSADIAGVEESPRKHVLLRKQSTFATRDPDNKDIANHSLPLDIFFENSPHINRKCLHLNSKVESVDGIRYQLFSAFEEIEINVTDANMEAII